jgi:hypothetical protein
MSHPLINLAKRTVFCDQPQTPSEAIYDPDLGIWKIFGGMLARTPRFAIVSKKKDIETGEDNKGQ